MKPKYNKEQIVFALSSISNAASSLHGTVEQLTKHATHVVVKALADPKVKSLIGGWELAWGPAIFQASKSNVADNAMYVAQNAKKKNEFVIAISGTNPISAYGWIVQDLMINPTVPWDSGKEETGKITFGTNAGLNNLLNVLVGTDGKSLEFFLAEQSKLHSKGLSITVTGHSLGGALSPALALDLKENQSSWDSTSKSTISVQPTAGPTSGDVKWRDYYDEVLGKKTNRLWNNIDMVPHAWQISMLKEIPTLYVPVIPVSPYIVALSKLGIINSRIAGNLQQICPKTQGLPGNINASITLSIKNLIALLEPLLLNELLEKLTEDMSMLERTIVKEIITEIVNELLKKEDGLIEDVLEHVLDFPSNKLKKLKSENLAAHKSFKDLMSYLIQVVYQHTTAYSELIGTTEYDAIVEKIKEEIPYPPQ